MGCLGIVPIFLVHFYLSVPDIDLEFDLDQAQTFWDSTDQERTCSIWRREDAYTFLYNSFLTQAQEKHLALRIVRCESSCIRHIVSDRHMIETIYINLIRIAIKFTREGEVEFDCRRNGREALFFVRDTCEGIPADKLDAIFERFVQADSETNRNRQ